MPDFFPIPELPISNLPKLERFGPLLTSPVAPRIPPGRPKNSRLLTFCVKISDFSGFLADFLPVQKPPKIKHLQKPPKIIKNRHLGAQGSDFHRFWMPFWLLFFVKFRNPRNGARPFVLDCEKAHKWRSKTYHRINGSQKQVSSKMIITLLIMYLFKI